MGTVHIAQPTTTDYSYSNNTLDTFSFPKTGYFICNFIIQVNKLISIFDIFSTIKDNYSYIKNNKNASYNDVMQKKLISVLIDVNGKVYINNDHELFETDICLNFKNKDKKTKQLYPLPDKRILNTQNKTFG